MNKLVLCGLGVAVLTDSPVEAQTVSIDHRPVGCVMADKFPRLEARFAPAETVATARVVFQGQSSDWYSVAMKPEALAYSGILPKPKKSLKSFRYYIEVTDKGLGTQRTSDYATTVVDGSSACQGKLMAGALASASVILQGPAGVVALPAGFASSGVVAGTAAGSGSAGAAGAAGGGGIGATALVLGGVAAAGGAAVALKKSEKASAQDLTEVRSYVLEGFVYNFLPAGPPVVGAVVSSSLDSVTTTTDAQGHFILRPQSQCVITIKPGSMPGQGGTGAVFTLTILAAGCPTWSNTRQWGCANADGTPTAPIIGPQGINLNCG